MTCEQSDLRQAIIQLQEGREYAQREKDREKRDREWREKTIPEREQKLIKLIRQSQSQQVVYGNTAYSVAPGEDEGTWVLYEEAPKILLVG